MSCHSHEALRAPRSHRDARIAVAASAQRRSRGPHRSVAQALAAKEKAAALDTLKSLCRIESGSGEPRRPRPDFPR
jgi:hypothetical protein